MSGHFDIDELLGHLGEGYILGLLDTDAGEHQFFIGIFVIDDQEAVVAAVLDRDEADEVAVVAELASLLLGRLVADVEGGRIGSDRIAPAKQDVRLVTLGDVVMRIDAGLDLLEIKGRRKVRRGCKRPPTEGGRDCGDGESTNHQLPAGKAGSDDLAHGWVRGRIATDVARVLKLARPHGFRDLRHSSPRFRQVAGAPHPAR
jgi:hypothetical protein